jgi:K+-sensing histidine kinase KdpD
LLQSDVLRPEIKDSIYAEVLHRDRCIGGLVIFSLRQEKAFSDSDFRLLQAIADDIAIAMEREQLAREADEARALYEADRLRSQFISSVSHELRTPLTIIKGYATSLLRQNVSWDKETQLEFLKSIDEKTDELRDLIDKILQSAKLRQALSSWKKPLLLPRIAKEVIEENIPRTRKHQFIMQFPPLFP